MELIKNLLFECLKVQVVAIPLILLSIWISKRSISTKYKWRFHRLTLVILYALNITLLLVFLSPNIGVFNISPNLDRQVVVDSEYSLEEEILTKDNDSQFSVEESYPLIESETSEILDDIPTNLSSSSSHGNINLQEHKKGFDYWLLLLIYPAVSVFLIFLIVIRFIIQYLEEKKIRAESSGSFLGSISIYYSKKVTSPFSIGIIFKRVYLPMSYKNRKDLDGILIHEFAHLHDNHPLWSIMELVYFSISWINPLVFIYKKRGELLRELIADEKAAECIDYVEYSSLIVKELQNFRSNGNIYYSLGFSRVSKINERIQNLLGIGHEKAGILIKVICISILLITAIAIYGVASSKEINIDDPNDFSYVNIANVTSLNRKLEKTPINNPVRTKMNGYCIPSSNGTNIDYTFYNSVDKVESVISVPSLPGETQLYGVSDQNELIIFSYFETELKGTLWNYSSNSRSKIIDLEEMGDYPVGSLHISPDGTVYLNASKFLFCIKDGMLLFKKRIAGEIKSMTTTDDGAIYYTTWMEREKIHRKDFLNDFYFSFTTNFENISLDYYNGALYIYDAKGIKKYVDDEFKGYVAYNKDFPELIGTNFIKLTVLDDRFLVSRDIVKGVLFSSFDYGGTYNIKPSNRKRSVDERPTITVGTISGTYDVLDYAAKVYNKRQNKVKIEIVQHSVYDGDYEGYQQRMNTRILAGEGEDIIYLPGLKYREFIDKGILTDLRGYIHEDINIDLYSKSLLAIQAGDEIFGLNIGFSETGSFYSARESLMKKYGYSGTYIDILWSDFIDILEEEKGLDREGNPLNPLAHYDFNLVIFCEEQLSLNNYFIRDDTFDTDGFSNFLDVCFKLKNENLLNKNVKVMSDQLFAQLDDSTKFVKEFELTIDFALLQEKHVTKEKMSFVRPTFDLNSRGQLGIPLGINRNSKYKDEAWEFLKVLLEDEFQSNKITLNPVKLSSLRDKLVWLQNNPEKSEVGYYGVGDELIWFRGSRKVSDEEIDETVEYFKGFNDDAYIIKDLDDFISKAVINYCNLKKSKEDVVKTVEERLFLYLNE